MAGLVAIGDGRHREGNVVAGFGKEEVPGRHGVQHREELNTATDVHLAATDSCEPVFGADAVALSHLRVEVLGLGTEDVFVNTSHWFAVVSRRGRAGGSRRRE